MKAKKVQDLVWEVFLCFGRPELLQGLSKELWFHLMHKLVDFTNCQSPDDFVGVYNRLVLFSGELPEHQELRTLEQFFKQNFLQLSNCSNGRFRMEIAKENVALFNRFLATKSP